jgi:amidase
MRPLNECTAIEIARLVAAGEARCEDVVRACLERIAEREPAVGAWQYLDPDYAIAQARALDRSGARGPLHGVPFGIKDIIDTHDMPTEYGSPIYAGHRPAGDAACVALSRKAGGILMGKTVTTEFANLYPGKTRNPRDAQRTPGGSSSGSAAAVADCMVPLAIGTQTTASTIRPAAFCGCVGYRPTWGDLRMHGVREAAGSLDTLGLFARSVEDVALYRDMLLRNAPQPIAAPPARLRVGFCRTHLWRLVDPVYQSRLEEAAQRLARAGASVAEVTLPPDFERVEDAHRWISSFEFSRNFTHEIEHHWERISAVLRNGRLKDGLACSVERYVEARSFAETQRSRLDAIFADYDVLMTASAEGEAPLGLDSTGNPALCAIWTTMHVPAITLPVFTGANGLPLGLQLIARRNEDRRLFATAREVWRMLS